MGSKACKNYIPARDSELMKRYRTEFMESLPKTETGRVRWPALPDNGKSRPV